MESFSDSFLSTWNVVFWGVTIACGVLTLIAQFGAFFIRQETTRRWKNELTRANSRIVTLQGHVTPRKFSEQQKEQLISLLKVVSKAKIPITSVIGDAEAYAFARDIADTLRLIPWDVVEIRPTMMQVKGDPTAELCAVVRDKNNCPDWVSVLQRAFTEIGVRMPAQMATLPASQRKYDAVIMVNSRFPQPQE